MLPPETIRLSDCWAKTYPTTGPPALTVRDHCLIVGAVAEAVFPLLPQACQNIPPAGAVTLTAAHDIGKITPGFLRKCALSQKCSAWCLLIMWVTFKDALDLGGGGRSKSFDYHH